MAGIDSYTKLMLHMDGSDDGTTFIDSSSNGYTVTRSGTVTKTGQYKFASASAYFNAASNNYLSIPASTDWDFGTGDFTIDFWVRPTDCSTRQYTRLIDRDYETVDRCFLIMTIYQHLYWSIPAGSGIETGNVLNDNTWTHVAVVRYGNVVTIYADGVPSASNDYGAGYTIPSSASVPLTMGEYVYNNTSPFLGYMDEVRVSKGIARWTADFSASLPAVAYSADTPQGTFIPKVIFFN